MVRVAGSAQGASLLTCVGSGVTGWGTEEEENMWEVDFDYVNSDSEKKHDPAECDMTVAELIEWRYLRAEREKEQVTTASFPIRSIAHDASSHRAT